jgi:hypothetical protein
MENSLRDISYVRYKCIRHVSNYQIHINECLHPRVGATNPSGPYERWDSSSSLEISVVGHS